jgi:hypothetical protein
MELGSVLLASGLLDQFDWRSDGHACGCRNICLQRRCVRFIEEQPYRRVDSHRYGEFDADPDANSDADTYTNSYTNSDADPDTDANAKPNADADTNANADANTNPDTNPDTNSDANTNANSNTHTYSDANPDTNSDANTNANSDANPNTNSDANPINCRCGLAGQRLNYYWNQSAICGFRHRNVQCRGDLDGIRNRLQRNRLRYDLFERPLHCSPGCAVLRHSDSYSNQRVGSNPICINRCNNCSASGGRLQPRVGGHIFDA